MTTSPRNSNKDVMALFFSMIAILFMQPLFANAITSSDDECIKRAYNIGLNLSETTENTMSSLAQLEADCIYSGKTSQMVKCLVWYYDIGIRSGDLILTPPNSTDLANYYTESDLFGHECTNLDLL